MVLTRQELRDLTREDESPEYDPDGMRDYLETLDRRELVQVAFDLYYDSQRLRREMDDLKGVIR